MQLCVCVHTCVHACVFAHVCAGDRGERAASVTWVVGIILTEEMTSEYRLEHGGVVSLKDNQGKTIPGSGRSWCKGPEVENTPGVLEKRHGGQCGPKQARGNRAGDAITEG